ncbi:DUF2785 domain-containing protein [Streptococcus caprae]|uniref:DUF2785 domain-containing protein n=1 Tax=Streptococcus caprae TaxID=1640501 RepID=A0ABV8CXE4_9STRE
MTRSFTALLLALIIDVDQQGDYVYKLTEDQRQWIFSDAIRYLHTETDATGWSEEFGWAHAIAHGADLLLFTGLHSAFPKERMPQILEAILKVLHQQTAVFSAGEEKRLARVLVQLLYLRNYQKTSSAIGYKIATFQMKQHKSTTPISTLKTCS